MLILHRESFLEPDAVYALLEGRVPQEWEGQGEGGGRVGFDAREARDTETGQE